MNEPQPFEKALVELEGILRALEDGSTTLEASLTQYERGIALLKNCYAQLQNAEQRIVALPACMSWHRKGLYLPAGGLTNRGKRNRFGQTGAE